MPATGARRGTLVYHWKHGWIPLDHFAALQKAHGSHSGAKRVMERHGISPVGTHHPGNASDSHFRMSGSELRDRAAKGDHAAQAELARRAARHAEKAAGKPSVEKRTPEPKPELPKVSDRFKTPLPESFQPEPPKREDAATHAARVAKNRQDFGPGSPEHLAALQAEDAALTEALNNSPTTGDQGHTLRSVIQKQFSNGTQRPFATLHRHEITNPNGSAYPLSIGRVQERHDQPGAFHAEHATYKQRGRVAHAEYHAIGTFDTREKAHKAIAVAQAQHHNALLDKRIKEAAAAERKAKKAQGVAGPNGHTWESVNPNELLVSSVGADLKRGRTADQVAARAKQSFKAGNYTVTVEANLSSERTKQLLRDVTTAVEATPLRNHEVNFVVPTGHSGFKGGAGGFVYAGGRTVYLSPTLVSGAKTHLFTQGDTTDFHMPASAHLGHDSNVSTIVHELGHVHDNINGHTRGGGQSVYYPGGGFSGTPSIFHGEQSRQMAKYARKNPAEGYAEAFMQYHVGGHGSHPAADAYAARYGWLHTPGIPRKV